MKNILIIGLGLMGGSLAKALKGFDAHIFGADINKKTLSSALSDGVIEKGAASYKELLPEADAVFICLPPRLAIEAINCPLYKKGALVSDICGVKGYILSNITNKDIDFIGAHPMAGRECSGYESSVAELFSGMNYLIIKNENNTPEHIAFLESVIKYIGCKKITYTTAKEHDKMIAYTSQLMHIVAAALCDNPTLDRAEAFSAGSLRDCTRVAKLDPVMWAELFVLNKDALSEEIAVFSDSLKRLRLLISSGDEEGIREFLTNTSQRKLKYLTEIK